MRTLATVCLTICLFSGARAQTQERSLVDRLLKPDMSLQNSAQNKQFRADGESINKRATVASFYFENKSKPRTFSETRDFRSARFDTRAFLEGKRRNSSSDKPANSISTFSGASLQHPVRDAYDHDKTVKGRDFADQHPFLDRGKSQKYLSRQTPPMTIEQVRELLNKNK